MKKSKWYSPLLVIAFLIIDYFILSYFDMLPASIQMPVPWHSKYRMMPVTGIDFTAEVQRYTETATVPVGAFDQIHSLNPNAGSFSAYPLKKNTWVYITGGLALKSHIVRTTEGGEPEVYYDGGLPVDTGPVKLYFSYLGHPYVNAKGTQYYRVQFSSDERLDSSGFQPDLLIELLDRQSRERISIHEYIILVDAWYTGQLLGWFPESGTVILRSGDGQTIQKTVIGGETEYYPIDQPIAAYGCIDEDSIVCSWDENETLGIFYLPTQEWFGQTCDMKIRAAAVKARDGMKRIAAVVETDGGGLAIMILDLEKNEYKTKDLPEGRDYTNCGVYFMDDLTFFHIEYTNHSNRTMIQYYKLDF